jgi:HDOD domain
VILKAAHEVRRQCGQPVPEDALEAVMAESHAKVGAAVLRRWRLPSGLDEPIVFHHNWTKATRAPRKAAVAYLANLLSHRYGFGCDANPVDLLADPVCAELAIDQAWLEQTDHHAPGLVDVAKKILG